MGDGLLPDTLYFLLGMSIDGALLLNWVLKFGGVNANTIYYYKNILLGFGVGEFV